MARSRDSRALGSKKLRQGSPRCAAPWEATATTAWSSALKVEGERIIWKTISLPGAVDEATYCKVLNTETVVRYWVTPSQEKKAGSWGLNGLAAIPAASVWTSKSMGMNVRLLGRVMPSSVSRCRFHCWVAG